MDVVIDGGKRTQFDDIYLGRCFTYAGNAYIKAEKGMGDVNACVQLRTGTIRSFPDSTYVISYPNSKVMLK